MVLVLWFAVCVQGWEWALEVEWRPTFCLTQVCSKEWKLNDFAITAFRPATFMECISDKGYSDPNQDASDLLRRFFPHPTDSNRHRELWKEQWERFGFCYPDFPTSTDYLLKAVSLLMDIHPMEKLIIAGITPGQSADITLYEQAFDRSVSIDCAGAVLSSITLYLDRYFSLVDGPGSPNNCPAMVSWPVQSAGRSFSLEM